MKFCQFLVLHFEKKAFLKILCYGTYVVGFQTRVIIDLLGMAFHAVIVIALFLTSLFILVSTCCGALCVTVGKINDVISSPLEQTITNGRLTRESITELITFGQRLRRRDTTRLDATQCHDDNAALRCGAPPFARRPRLDGEGSQ